MTTEEYLTQRSQFTPDSPVYEEARKKFLEEHPDCPKPKPIECLNLIMRREFAEQILSDKDMLAYEDKYWDDELMRMQIIDFTNSVRAVKKIHFHNYNNSWFLDVECVDNSTVIVNDEQVGYLRDEFGCHEFDEELTMLNRRKAEDRPIYFYFAVGQVISTNLC